mmetsp:Transcript_121331/g.181243  ORF Transcript_121331/g.181243 Transcript_121331/m.181243 type:complete len:698 (+) Transcript_121331:133-2226(+)
MAGLTAALFFFLCERLFTTALADTAVTPNLPFGDINVVVLTDVHSFVGGHRHDPTANANYGDVLSFYEHLKEYSDAQGQDLWFVMNGDWMHGTGLALDGNAENIMPILKRMPWDAVTLGNHESYSQAVVELMKEEMLPTFEGRYLTSNVKETATNEPFGEHYTILEGTNNRLMVFGFLYNHCEPSNSLKVKRVQEAVQQEWFTKALEDEEYDAIMVLAHMGFDSSYVTHILNAIREVVGKDMPVQFITGHTHVRAEQKVDLWSHAFEAGAFLDTVGFVSFPNHARAAETRPGLAASLFQFQFMDGSVHNLTAALQIEPADDFTTENGASLTEMIKETREKLALTQVVACPPHDYFRDVPIHGHNSMWDLWRNHAAREQILKRDPWSVMMVSKDAVRHDIRGSLGDIELDDVVAIAPFMEPVLHLGKIPSWVIRRANNTLNTASHHKNVPDFVLSGDIEADGDYDFYTQTYSLHAILEAFERLGVKDLTPVHTGERDTLYWLRFLEDSFPCGERVTHMTPWFKNIHKLDEEAGDSHVGDEDSWDTAVDTDVLIGSPTVDRQANQSGGYQGYLPPATIDQYHSALPPGSAPSAVHKVTAPTPSSFQPKHTKQELEKKQKKKHQLKRTIFKSFALVIGSIMLCVPIYCFIQSIRGRNRSEWDDEDGLVYDREELKALRSNGKRKGRNSRPRPRPTEIEIT